MCWITSRSCRAAVYQGDDDQTADDPAVVPTVDVPRVGVPRVGVPRVGGATKAWPRVAASPAVARTDARMETSPMAAGGRTTVARTDARMRKTNLTVTSVVAAVRRGGAGSTMDPRDVRMEASCRLNPRAGVGHLRRGESRSLETYWKSAAS
jgi:hypothetical protein